MVSTHMRGAVIFTSAYKVFLPPSHRDVDIQFHALWFITSLGNWRI